MLTLPNFSKYIKHFDGHGGGGCSGHGGAVTYRELVRKLRRAGFGFDRTAAGSHEIWFNPKTRRRTTVPNHPGDIPAGTVRAIIRQTGLSKREFDTL